MDARRLKKILLSLVEPALRLGFLRSELEQLGESAAAILLDDLAEESEVGDEGAREVMLSVAILLCQEGRSEFTEALRRQAAAQELFSLDRLVRRAPPPSIAAPPSDELRIPDYGKGRELSLGERKSLARRPDRRAMEKLCLDPHPLVIRQLLENPKMVEDDAIRIATIRPARREAILELARSHRWLSRPRVRLAIMHNPGSPPEVAIPLVALCNREELVDLLKSTETSLVLRGTARELLLRKPPVKEDGNHTMH
jgi:hypothetical protein